MASNKKQELRDVELENEISQSAATDSDYPTAYYPQNTPYPYGYPVPQYYGWVPAYDPRGLVAWVVSVCPASLELAA